MLIQRECPTYRNQNQIEIMYLGKHAEQSCLICYQSGQCGLPIGVIEDHESFEPIGPAIRQMTFHTNLVNTRCVHISEIYWSSMGRIFSAQARMAFRSRRSPRG